MALRYMTPEDSLEFYILAANFVPTGYIDTYESAIWTDRYNECGDFEIVIPASVPNVSEILNATYLYNKFSDRIMVVEDINVSTDPEEGNKITISGRSLESMLDRRVVWEITNLDTNAQDAIKKLLNDNMIEATDYHRKVYDFEFDENPDPAFTEYAMQAEYYGDDLYSAICDIATLFDIGWKITLDSSRVLHFALYLGTDRSYGQTENPFVIFSDKFENLLSSSYESNMTGFKNAILLNYRHHY